VENDGYCRNTQYGRAVSAGEQTCRKSSIPLPLGAPEGIAIPTQNPPVAFQEIPEYHPANTEQNPINSLPIPTIEISMVAKRTKGQTTLFKPAVPRDPEILDVQATADMIGISKDAVYYLFKKGELPGRKVARRWLTTRDSVLRWLKGSSEEDALARAIANGDTKALTAALTSGKFQVKKRK